MKNHLLLLLGFLFVSFNVALPAQQDSLKESITKTQQLKSYIDSLVNAGMEEYRIPGAVVTIVTDSSDVFTQGYGYSDLEENRKVDPEKSIFRIASVTKTFTAMAVMQLVEEGKVELHTDIRKYLPDDDFDFLSWEPVTLHQLLTHTAGFDITDTGDAALTPEAVIPLEELARRHMPDQVHSPGSVHSYSNFGYALAGYVIQAVSGMPYEEFIQKRILEPLQMDHTGITQPLPPLLKENLSKSYTWNGSHKSLKRDYTNTLPGGGIITSGADMSNYMLMHLNGGQFNDKVVLGNQFHDALTSQQYGSRGTKYGICYAFTENFWRGYRSIEHTGAQLGFLSLMILIPETGTGIFIAQNSRKDVSNFRWSIASKLLDTLIQEKRRSIESLVPPDNFDAIAANYTGTYTQMNHPYNSFEKVSQLFGIFFNEAKVEYNGDGRLSIFGRPYIQISDHLFEAESPESTHKVEFIVDENGRSERIFSGIYSYEKTPWYLRKRTKQIAMIFGMVVLLIQFFARPITLLVRKIKGTKLPQRRSWISDWQYWTGSLFVLGAIGVLLISIIYEDQISDYGVPWSLKFVMLMNTIGFISALASPFILWKVIQSELLSRRLKVWSIFVTLAIIVVAVVLFSVRMVGWQYYG